MLSSGFANAPVTQLALVSIIVSSIAVSIFDVKYLFSIEVVPHLWGWFQFWRLLVWQACYLNSTEVLQAGMVLYSLRVVERLWGSRKFASFLLSTLPYTCLLPPILLALFIRPLSLNTLNYLPAGPTAILFSILAQYHAAIPSTYKYHVATTSATPTSTGTSSSIPALRFTDKSTTYFLALQLSLSQFPYSILPAVTGWIIGHAWRAELLPGRASSWRIPGWIYGGDPSAELRRQAGLRRRTAAGEQGGAEGVTGRDAQRYAGLRRRLEGESRAAAAAAATGDPRVSTGSSDAASPDTQQARPLAGQILDRFRGGF